LHVSNKSVRSTSHLQQFHWLPIEKRINIKTCYTYFQSPSYPDTNISCHSLQRVQNARSESQSAWLWYACSPLATMVADWIQNTVQTLPDNASAAEPILPEEIDACHCRSAWPMQTVFLQDAEMRIAAAQSDIWSVSVFVHGGLLSGIVCLTHYIRWPILYCYFQKRHLKAHFI